MKQSTADVIHQALVVSAMAINSMLIMALNFKQLAPSESIRFAVISMISAGLTVVLGVFGKPLIKQQTQDDKNPQ